MHKDGSEGEALELEGKECTIGMVTATGMDENVETNTNVDGPGGTQILQLEGPSGQLKMVGEWLLQQVQELLSPVLSWLQKLEERCKDLEDGLGLQKGYGLAERIQIMQADLEEWKGAQNTE